MGSGAKGFQCPGWIGCPAALSVIGLSQAHNDLEEGHWTHAGGVQGLFVRAHGAALSQWHHFLQEDQQGVAGSLPVRGQEHHRVWCQQGYLPES